MNQTQSSITFIPLSCIALLQSLECLALDITGNVNFEARYFNEPAAYESQHDRENLSASINLEFDHSFSRDLQVSAELFGRLDQNDSRRTHTDIRELYLEYATAKFDILFGINKVFWGTAESQHLVDIINQIDFIENIDGEEKLGQLMLRAGKNTAFGRLELYLLPGSRQRTYPNENGRLRFPLEIKDDDINYESSRQNKRLDTAVRWSHSVRALDIGLSHFSGTAREPLLTASDEQLQQYYPIIDQTGLEAQITLSGWLLKLEAITSDRFGDRYSSLVSGFEYTLFGIQDSMIDIGIVLEYSLDDRNDAQETLFNSDIFAGVRFNGNDTQSTEALIGILQDTETEDYMLTVEANRRLTSQSKISLEARLFSGEDKKSQLSAIDSDNYIQFNLIYFF